MFKSSEVLKYSANANTSNYFSETTLTSGYAKVCLVEWNRSLFLLWQQQSVAAMIIKINTGLKYFTQGGCRVAFTPGPFCFLPKQTICSESVCIFLLGRFLFTRRYCKVGRSTHPRRASLTPFKCCLSAGCFALWDSIMTTTMKGVAG